MNTPPGGNPGTAYATADRYLIFGFSFGNSNNDGIYDGEHLNQHGPSAPPDPPYEDNCEFLVRVFGDLIAKHKDDWLNRPFVDEINKELIASYNPHSDDPVVKAKYDTLRASGFKGIYTDEAGSFNQVRHFAGGFVNAYYGGLALYTANSVGPLTNRNGEAIATAVLLSEANKREKDNSSGDIALNGISVPMGVGLAFGSIKASDLPGQIRSAVCN